jgi:dynein regulatory complex protein 1
LSSSLQNLQLELEHIKFATVLNMEKLEYNLEVLRRRENENLKMKNSMKRLLLRLQDRFNDRAKQLQDQIERARKENEKVIKEIRRLEFLNRDARRKTLHIVATDYHKFMDLWALHEEDARDKLTRLLSSEAYIFETQLGVKLPEVNLAPLDTRPREVHCFINKLEYVPPSSRENPI